MELPRMRDATVLRWAAAPVLGALAVQEALLDPVFRDSLGLLLVVAAWLVVALLLTAVRATAGAVAVALFFPLGELLQVPGPGGAGLIAALLACGWAGYADPRSRSRWAVGGAIAVFVLTAATVQPGNAWDTVFFCALFLPAWWTGTLVRREQRRSRQLVELAAALDAEREAGALAAAAAERTRIAREVHDAVAHSVSIMTLHVGGLRRQLDDVLVERPVERELMLGVERLGRESVEELRALVGILRESGPQAPAAPTPSLARAAELVADVRTAGLPVELQVVGEPTELPRALDVSAYRVLQEALSNVLRHAGAAPTRVVLRYAPDAVVVEVQDDGAPGRLVPAQPGATGGHGLVGMRERVALFGGRLETGPLPGGGFGVRARFPVSHRFAGSTS